MGRGGVFMTTVMCMAVAATGFAAVFAAFVAKWGSAAGSGPVWGASRRPARAGPGPLRYSGLV